MNRALMSLIASSAIGEIAAGVFSTPSVGHDVCQLEEMSPSLAEYSGPGDPDRALALVGEGPKVLASRPPIGERNVAES